MLPCVFRSDCRSELKASLSDVRVDLIPRRTQDHWNVVKHIKNLKMVLVSSCVAAFYEESRALQQTTRQKNKASVSSSVLTLRETVATLWRWWIPICLICRPWYCLTAADTVYTSTHQPFSFPLRRIWNLRLVSDIIRTVVCQPMKTTGAIKRGRHISAVGWEEKVDRTDKGNILQPLCGDHLCRCPRLIRWMLHSHMEMCCSSLYTTQPGKLSANIYIYIYWFCSCCMSNNCFLYLKMSNNFSF